MVRAKGLADYRERFVTNRFTGIGSYRLAEIAGTGRVVLRGRSRLPLKGLHDEAVWVFRGQLEQLTGVSEKVKAVKIRPAFPGLAIFPTGLVVNLLGDQRRDWLDLRLRHTLRSDQR